MVARFIQFVLFLGMLAMTTLSQASTVHILHNSFISYEKIKKLESIAQQEGVRLESTLLSKTLAAAPAIADVYLFDTPRPSDREEALKYIESTLGQDKPYLLIGGGAPVVHHWPRAQGMALAKLYGQGGEESFRRFFKAMHSVESISQLQTSDLLVSSSYGSFGIYHPEATQVFPNIENYIQWFEEKYGVQTGRIAFWVSSNNIKSLITDNLDELIYRAKAHGLMPIVFFAELSAEESVVNKLGGKTIDALVNMTHLQHGNQLTKDFLMLDIPVIQTLRFREGDRSSWPKAKSGVSASTTAIFIATPETWGMSDPIVLSASQQGVDKLLPSQADALIKKLQRLVSLRKKDNAEKKIAMLFWNYPKGERNLGASNLNVPQSILSIMRALNQDGYQTVIPDEKKLIQYAQRLLEGSYTPQKLDALLAEDLADVLAVEDFRDWLKDLPKEQHQHLLEDIPLAQHPAVREINGQLYFIIPRLKLGHVLVMPQLKRHTDNNAHYHDLHSHPDAWYLAAYLYLQKTQDALIHLGTHGTQEWLPGKDRGLAAEDYPWFALGDLPVFYPYIQDNVGEAIQAKRRGRAVVISHRTPPFTAAGMYAEWRDLHELLHQYQQLEEGGTRQGVRQNILDLVDKTNAAKDMAWTDQDIHKKFDEFLLALHDHLHELATQMMPLGLHTFGEVMQDEQLIAMVIQQLGDEFFEALGIDIEERVESNLQTSSPYQLVQSWLMKSEPATEDLQKYKDKALLYYQVLKDVQENQSLLAGLNGKFIPAGAGGDSIRNPMIENGRNLYAFEATKIPAAPAYESAKEAFQQVLESYQQQHNTYPQKLAFSLWSSETIRHLGVSEAQILHALGLQPIWDTSGKLIDLHIIPRQELGRARVDVVVQVTGVYRDQFDYFLQMLDKAIHQLAQMEEADNPIYHNSLRIEQNLKSQSIDAKDALLLSRSRVFSQEAGEYGTGVSHLALDSTSWEKEDTLAQQFLNRHSNILGLGAQVMISQKQQAFAEQLKGTQVAVLARSSNLHGVLSTDHPFEYLGGISAAVNYLDGKTPDLLISDLRRQKSKTTVLNQFLSNEMQTRYLNPKWIQEMKEEGYSGTLAILNVQNNLFGWQVMDNQSVRDDQWQAMFDVYIKDKYDMALNQWFEEHNPSAQAQILERMAEAIRKGYWQASESTKEELVKRLDALSSEHQLPALTQEFVQTLAHGFGLNALTRSQSSESQESLNQEMTDTIQGQVLTEKVVQQQEENSEQEWILLCIFFMLLGGLMQYRQQQKWKK